MPRRAKASGRAGVHFFLDVRVLQQADTHQRLGFHGSADVVDREVGLASRRARLEESAVHESTQYSN